MKNINIYKYKHINVNKLNITDSYIDYDLEPFYIQSPLFTDYKIMSIYYRLWY